MPLLRAEAKHGWILAWTLFVAAALLLTARVNLLNQPGAQRLTADLERLLGQPVELRAVHLDLLSRGGLVLRDFRVALGSWTLEVPEAVVRPAWGSLLEGELLPSISARSYVVRTDAEDAPEALLRVRELLEMAHFPEAKLALQGGAVRIGSGRALLENVLFHLDGTVEPPHLFARAAAGGRGRVDVRGERDPDGALTVRVFPQRVPLADGREWLAEGGVTLPSDWHWPSLPISVTGRWRVGIEADGAVDHRFDLELLGDRVPFALQVSGGLRSEGERIAHGSSVRLVGTLGRLRGEPTRAEAPLLLSGPVRVELDVVGPTDAVRLYGDASLDDAYVAIADLARKPSGIPARMRFSSIPVEGGRVLTLGADLGALRVRAVREGLGPLVGESDWVDATRLVSLLPALEGRASSGRLRISSLELAGADAMRADVELDGVAFAGRRMPITVRDLRGVASVGSSGFGASNLVARVADIPMTASLLGRFDDSGAPRISLDVEAGEIDLARLGVDLAAPASATGEAGALIDAARGPVTMLRRERARVDDLVVERARFHAALVRGRGVPFRNLDLEMALDSLRLELRRARFSLGDRLFRYAGMIDLNPLVPDIEIASVP